MTNSPHYVALLRGINVGGRNVMSMADLAQCFREGGFSDVRTYIQSGNVLFRSEITSSQALESVIEKMLAERFDIPILTTVRSRDELAAIIAAAPQDHGSPTLRSDVFFLKPPLSAEEAFAHLPVLREGVDLIAAGEGVLYFSRVDAEASKTRITRLNAKPMFKQMTVRNWRTTTRLLAMLDDA